MKHLFDIKVVGLVYEVYEDGEVLSIKGMWGETQHQEQRVLLSDRITSERRREVMIHEMLHMASTSVLSGNLLLTEDQVSPLSVALHQMFVDNPPLREFMFEGMK